MGGKNRETAKNETEGTRRGREGGLLGERIQIGQQER